MKKFTINCDFNGQLSPVTVFLGQCKVGNHPLHFQAEWLSKERGGQIPSEVMDAISRLVELSEKNNVSFEDLCVYALGTAQQTKQNEETEADTNDNSTDEDSLGLNDDIEDSNNTTSDK